MKEDEIMEKNIVIGIEGLVGSGKTSICREILKRNDNAILLNGGNLYRAIVYTLMQKEPNILKLKKMTKNADIKKYMDDLKVEIRIEDRESKIYIDGRLADEEELQSKASSLAVSIIGGIADNTKLFEFASNLIDELSKFRLKEFSHNPQTLEEYFISFYVEDKDFGGLK